ncbi:TraX family protein, partial [Escherichia coli]|uniref:TraX family protein n=1 Tax=Escherichia coli TaxID=562 RepID=UPI0034DB05FC
ESGGVVTRTQDFEPGGQVFSRGEWLTIIRVNKSNGAVSSVTTPNYSFLGYYLAGFPWYEGNILFAFAVAAQVLTWCETR